MRKLLLALALVFTAGAAYADNGLLYLGAGLTDYDLRDIGQTNTDLTGTNFKVWASVRPLSVFAVEADYYGSGSQSVGTPNSVVYLHFKSYAGYAVGYLPLGLPWLELFAKAGVGHWTLSGFSDCTGNGCFSGPVPYNGSQFAWGIGGQAHLGNVGARLEYESFSIPNTGAASGANMVSLSVFLNLF